MKTSNYNLSSFYDILNIYCGSIYGLFNKISFHIKRSQVWKTTQIDCFQLIDSIIAHFKLLQTSQTRNGPSRNTSYLVVGQDKSSTFKLFKLRNNPSPIDLIWLWHKTKDFKLTKSSNNFSSKNSISLKDKPSFSRFTCPLKTEPGKNIIIKSTNI